MHRHNIKLSSGSHPTRHYSIFFLIILLLAGVGVGLKSSLMARAQGSDGSVQFKEGVDPAQWYQDHEIENSWTPDYLDLATGDPILLSDHGVYAWPFDLDSIGWSMQSYQDYGGTPYFHHGMDMMKMFGTNVFNRSGGQVVNIENYQPGNYLYWEIAVLDPDGYLWQYHHVDQPTIPQYIWDKYDEFLIDPVNGGFIDPDTYIGDIVEWPVWSYGKQFNHIHLNIIAAGGYYVNGFEFHNPLPDTVGPEIQDIGLLLNGQIYPDFPVEGNYSLYVRSRDLILDDVYYLPPWEFKFSVDGGPVNTTYRFDRLPGYDRYQYLDDFYVVPPTCGNYDCRDYYVDLGFIPDSQYVFPKTGGQHTIQVTVSDYAGNVDTQTYTYTVIGPPPGTPVWQDDFETDQGWITDPNGSDTATSGQWEWGDPESTYSSGPKQLGTTFNGQNDLVTGRLAGGNATTYDIDGGLTSIRSQEISLPMADSLTLSFRYYLAHGSNSSSADYLRVTVVGSSSAMVFEELGGANNDDGVWAINNVGIDAFAGENVHLLIEAADASGESLVEAGIDDVLIVATGINQAPVADPQSVSTPEDTPLDILLTGSDPDNEPITYTLVTTPTHGVLSGIAPSLTYTPSPDYNGPDSFTFVVDDGLETSPPAAISIEVTAVNDAPVAYPGSVTTWQSVPVAVTLNGADIEGDVLAYHVTILPEHGILSGTGADLIYTPDPGFRGEDSFTFVTNDGELDSAPALISIRVNPVSYVPLIFR